MLTGAPCAARADKPRARHQPGRPRRHAHRHRVERDGWADQQLPRRRRAVRDGAVLAGHHRRHAGYHHDNERFTGFSLTHASVGCPAFGDIPMLPTTTPIGSRPWSAWEKIAHDNTEVGVPGYYTARFPDTGVTAELTATTRTGVGRFHYPPNGRPALFHVRSGGSLAGNSAATIEIGERQHHDHRVGDQSRILQQEQLLPVYFAMKFSRPFTSYGTWDGKSVYAGARSEESSSSGGYVVFPAGSVVEVRTALSYVGVDGARANLAAEGGASFDDVRAAASSEWNAALSRIAVAGTNSDDVKTFYTSLYRSLLHPNTFNDADGRYLGFDGAIHTVAKGHTQYANFSDWDTYRCLAALQGLVFPERASDMAQSLVNDAKQSGSLPRWALANSATGEMTGDNVVPLIVNLYTFGAKGFEVKAALYLHAEGGHRRRCRAGRLCGAAGNRYLPPARLRAADRGIPRRSWVRRRLGHAGVVDRRLRHLSIRRLVGRQRDWRRIPEPGAVLAEPVQSGDRLTSRRAAPSGAFLVSPGFAGPTRISDRTDSTRATPSSTCGWCRRTSPA